MDGLTWAALLTAAGAVTAATIITLFIDVLKAAFPFVQNWNGMTMAFVLSAILYIAAALFVGISTPDVILGDILAWLSCAAAAVGVHTAIVKPISNAVKSQ